MRQKVTMEVMRDKEERGKSEKINQERDKRENNCRGDVRKKIKGEIEKYKRDERKERLDRKIQE